MGLAGQECVSGLCKGYANCLANMCACSDGYFVDDTRNCQRRRGMFTHCAADFQCESTDDRPLKCVEGLCICNPETSVYGQISTTIVVELYIPLEPGWFQNRTTAGCLPLPGQACSKRGLCSPRSNCVKGANPKTSSPIVISSPWFGEFRKYNGWTDDNGGQSPPPPSDPKKNYGTCECQSDFVLSANNRCGRPFGARCYSHDECLDGLVCKDRACACELDTQAFSQSQTECTSKIRGPCNADSDCEWDARCKLISGY